jgi:hypothetical protein
MNMTGWYRRSDRRNRGEKSMISTALPSSANNVVERTAVFGR